MYEDWQTFAVGTPVTTGLELQYEPHNAALQWVAIKETDDEKTRARKKKLQKSFKSKQRFQEMDKVTQKKQQSWLDFKSGKGAKKKVREPDQARRAPLHAAFCDGDTSQRCAGVLESLQELMSLWQPLLMQIYLRKHSPACVPLSGASWLLSEQSAGLSWGDRHCRLSDPVARS